MIDIASPAGASDPSWLALRSQLWPEVPESEHLLDMAAAIERHFCVRIAVSATREGMGFVEASVRTDYVNGTSSSPVAFIEGLYVRPSARHRGIARALVAEVDRWASCQGCREIASDSPTSNAAAHAFHRAVGFVETERVVYFCKPVRPTQHSG